VNPPELTEASDLERDGAHVDGLKPVEVRCWLPGGVMERRVVLASDGQSPRDLIARHPAAFGLPPGTVAI
jgi:hypothetical protein